MKHLRISSITWFIGTYAAFHTTDMNAIMSDYFLSQLYERDYVLFSKVEQNFKNPSSDAIHATHLK